jgi:hypothetical protein
VDDEGVLSDSAQVRRNAIKAIRDELPRVLAELGIFVDDPDDDTEDADVFLPNTMLDEMAEGVVDRATAA